jgi:NADH:ubiquinone oxidoreductase subunit 5 (subunit L)/multisubunit Na+/H+ antiporter MnhA subunit
MGKIKDYTTDDPVMDNSEISLQVSNGVIIIFPIISLFCIYMLDEKYRNKIAIILFITILEGMFSVANHIYHHDNKNTTALIFEWLDVIGVIILGILSFLLIFDIILKTSPVQPTHPNSVKLLYRIFYIITAVFMIGSFIYANHKINDKDKARKKQNRKIYNQYHNIWHMSGAMLISITILYVFTFHLKQKNGM